jgi:hypothetical protein
VAGDGSAAYRGKVAVEWLEIIVVVVVVAVAGRFVFGVFLPSLGTLEMPAALGRVRRVRRQTAPSRRPLEQVARDLRRLGPKFHHPPPGTSRVKIEAARYAYDRALGDAATAVGVEHLLAVLPPGPDLDAERYRVETLLWRAGVRFETAA